MLLIGFALAVTAGAAETADLKLIPFPKECRQNPGRFMLDALRLESSAEPAQQEALLRLLNEELQIANLPPAEAGRVTAPALMFRVLRSTGAPAVPELPANPAAEAYALEVRPEGIVCAARTPNGLVYGMQTLRQLIRANRDGPRLPCVSIRDWPALRWRCFQDDMTRGPSSTLDTLKFEAGLGSYLKLNLMTFYMEYQFAFTNHPRIGPTNGSLTAAELRALVEHVKPLAMDLLGNQQSFGHFGRILRHPEYAALRETGDVLTPVREETYELLDDLYSEVCPLLPFPWFNVCCDETYGLGTGPSKELAGEIGIGGVYVRHIRRVHDLLRERYGKRMMMWGDIILQHPDHLAGVPRDTIMLTWGYDARASFEDQIIPFARSGYEFFVCPGVNNWSRILPDFGVAVTNIQHFVRDGITHGALGMLNTDWEDDGEAINAVKWHADAWAAECAWNGATTSIESFNHRVGAILFGETQDHFGEAVKLLAQTHRLPGMKGMMNHRFWQDDFMPRSSAEAIGTTATNLLALVRPARGHLDACRQEARVNRHVLDAFSFGARRMERIGLRMLDGVEAAHHYQAAYDLSRQSAPDPAALERHLERVQDLIRQNRDAHAALQLEFERLWLAESKPYALDWTRQRYRNLLAAYDDLLRKTAEARSLVQTSSRQGNEAQTLTLPSPDAIGLALPQPLSRCRLPHSTDSVPLAPEQPWFEPTATHRLGLTISAGAANRSDLPVEVNLALPASLAHNPVRAFRMDPARELLAQLDPVGASSQQRLTLMLPGHLPKGSKARVHVYLGLPATPAPLAEAVHTRAADQGGYWLENNQVRLLVGREGAHVYRWELKSANGQDLTMPGTSGWAGFADMATHRHSPSALNITARGPALVELAATDANGHAKIIRLYGGASWIEIFLGEPTTVYWDFDNPRNFAADGPTPGRWAFSDGRSGQVGREADGVPAQVRAEGVHWGVKFNTDKLALGLITPETAAAHLVAPGAAAGGVGIERSVPARHFVTFAGLLERPPAETMRQLQETLDLRQLPAVRQHTLQAAR